MSVNEKMTAIADNIRDKTGGTEALTLDDMASGVNEVYEAGKKSQYDEFWDAYQNQGYYMPWGGYLFAYKGWTDKNFFPKYDVVFQNGGNGANFYQNAVTNLRERIDGRGLKMRFLGESGTPTFSMMYRFAKTTEVPDCDTSKVQNFVEAFQSATNLVTIPRLNVSKATNLTNTFAGTSALENITFEGVIPISISFAFSPLSIESMKSIITHLKDYAGTTGEYTYTVTFKASAFEALEAEGATAEYTDAEGNTTLITWAEYIDNLKWNLVKA